MNHLVVVTVLALSALLIKMRPELFKLDVIVQYNNELAILLASVATFYAWKYFNTPKYQPPMVYSVPSYQQSSSDYSVTPSI